MSIDRSANFEFPHRMNKDGTIDSICPRCFVTLGRSTWEADLDRMEAAHLCQPAIPASFRERRRISVFSEPISDPLSSPTNLRRFRSGACLTEEWYPANPPDVPGHRLHPDAEQAPYAQLPRSGRYSAQS